LKIALNGIIVENTNDLYIHQNQVWIYTTHSEESIEANLSLAGVVLIKGDMEWDGIVTVAKQSEAYKARQEQLDQSGEVTWTGLLRTPLTEQERLLPPEVSLRVVLTKAENAHVIMCKDTDKNKYKAVITECQLIVPKVRLNNSSHLALETMIHERDAVFNIHRFQSSYITMPKDIQSTIVEHMLSGTSPICSFVTMLEGVRFVGREEDNSVKYGGFNVQSIKYNLEEEGDIREAIKVSSTDQSNAVLALYEGLGLLGGNKTIPINIHNFKDGYNLFLFNHTNNLEIDKYDSLQELKRGNIKFQLELGGALGQATVVVIHMLFVSTIRITGDRRIIHDY
jgi:hypothetical protein